MKTNVSKNRVYVFLPGLLCLFVLFSVRANRLCAETQIGTKAAKESAKQSIVQTPLSGSWHAADEGTLKKEIDDLYAGAKVESIDHVIALILPHAGYRYSGRTAAMALQAVKDPYKRIIIIAPSHYVPMEDIFSVSRATHYQTPLGLSPVDTEFVDKLLQYPIFQEIPQANQREHSVHIEIPLIQRKWKDIQIVPIVAGQCSMPTITKAASILSGLIDRDTLVIVSCDFTHYGPNYDYVPFKDSVPEQLKKLDMGAYDYIAQKDAEGFLEYRAKTGATICGYVPIAVVLSMLDKTSQAHLMDYTTSGRVTGDFSNSVSYFAIALSGQWSAASPVPEQTAVPVLTREDKDKLLTLARQSITHYLEKTETLELPEADISPQLKIPRAAFVTLNIHTKAGLVGPVREIKQLRGCIGDIFPRQPLYKSVITNAVNAAVNDPRFKPVAKEELRNIMIEISVLTAPEPVNTAQDIRIGTDGVVLRKDGRSAVFLPQVAPEQGWSREEMLEHLSQKAGLPADAWKEGASFLTFQADVFGEGEE